MKVRHRPAHWGDDILTHIAAGKPARQMSHGARKSDIHVRNIHGAIAVSDTAQPRYLTVPPRPGAKRRSAPARVSGSRREARGHGARTESGKPKCLHRTDGCARQP